MSTPTDRSTVPSSQRCITSCTSESRHDTKVVNRSQEKRKLQSNNSQKRVRNWTDSAGDAAGQVSLTKKQRHDIPKTALDPISLEALGEHIFVYTRTNQTKSYYNVHTLVDYMLSTGDFRDPVTRSTFSDLELQELDAAAIKAGLNRESLVEAKADTARWAEAKMHRDAVCGVEQMVLQEFGSVRDYFYHLGEHPKIELKSEACAKLLTTWIPSLQELIQQLSVASRDAALTTLDMLLNTLNGKQRRPVPNPYGTRSAVEAFLQEMHSQISVNSMLLDTSQAIEVAWQCIRASDISVSEGYSSGNQSSVANERDSCSMECSDVEDIQPSSRESTDQEDELCTRTYMRPYDRLRRHSNDEETNWSVADRRTLPQSALDPFTNSYNNTYNTVMRPWSPNQSCPRISPNLIADGQNYYEHHMTPLSQQRCNEIQWNVCSTRQNNYGHENGYGDISQNNNEYQSNVTLGRRRNRRRRQPQQMNHQAYSAQPYAFVRNNRGRNKHFRPRMVSNENHEQFTQNDERDISRRRRRSRARRNARARRARARRAQNQHTRV